MGRRAATPSTSRSIPRPARAYSSASAGRSASRAADGAVPSADLDQPQEPAGLAERGPARALHLAHGRGRRDGIDIDELRGQRRLHDHHAEGVREHVVELAGDPLALRRGATLGLQVPLERERVPLPPRACALAPASRRALPLRPMARRGRRRARRPRAPRLSAVAVQQRDRRKDARQACGCARAGHMQTGGDKASARTRSVEDGSSVSPPISPPRRGSRTTTIGMASGSARRAHSTPAASQHAPASPRVAHSPARRSRRCR